MIIYMCRLETTHTFCSVMMEGVKHLGLRGEGDLYDSCTRKAGRKGTLNFGP